GIGFVVVAGIGAERTGARTETRAETGTEPRTQVRTAASAGNGAAGPLPEPGRGHPERIGP
ncbi:MAG: hypothetical protein K0R62_8710, partial [Nonomuraea muscovyensis]|nr:hypothetical protein [Nonomuraea muscovyensis]